MRVPDYLTDEANRLLALHRTNLLDSPPEERFDRITRLAARFFGVQTCLVSLVGSDRLWFKSRVGQKSQAASRDISFCAHAILDQCVLAVNDTTKDARFSANPLVTADPKIRFYAGAPVREPSGQPLGTLCLVDPSPREFSDEQKQTLRDFADMVEHEIAQIDHTEIHYQLTSSMARTSSIFGTLPDMVFVIDREFRFLVCNEHPDLPEPRYKMLGRTIEEVLPDKLGGELSTHVEKAFSSNGVIHHNYVLADTKKSFEARYRKIDQKEVLVIIRDTTEQTLVNAEIGRLSEVARQTTNGVVITDENGLVVWTNEAFTDIAGYSLEEMAGKRPGEVLQGGDTDPATVKVIREALANDESFNVDLINYSKTRTPYWVRIACNLLWDDDGELKGYIAIETDITKEKHDEDQIRKSDKLLKAVIDANTIGTWQLNLQSGELLINDQWAELLGYELHELMPTDRKTWENLTHPEDLARCSALLKKHAAGKIPIYAADIRMKHKTGKWVWINTRGRVSSHSNDGRAEWLLGTHFDISAQIKAESTLDQKSKQMQAIVDNMLDGVVSIDKKGIVLTFNQAAEDIFGYSSNEIIGRNINLIIGSKKDKQHDNYLTDYIVKGIGHVTGRIREIKALHKTGAALPIELGLVEVQQSGETNFIGIVRDITERKKRDREIRQLAFYDPLTQLPNRRLLLDRLQRVIANCVRNNRYAALFFLDLDNFKNLNDSAGHNIGDLLLYLVAQRLTQSVRQTDTVSRLGGDEFVVLIENLSADESEAAVQAETTAEKIITELTRSFDLEGLTYNGSASIGITLFNGSHLSQDDLLKQADMAMYGSKAAGRNAIRFYDPQMQVAVSKRAEIEQDLHDAVRHQQFQLYYQKQVDQQGRMTGTEVLLRWIHPEKGIISPAQFIPLAEETGLIVPIGEWVLNQACQTLFQWSTDPASADLTIAVNISVVQFRKTNIVATVLNALKISGANPHNLKLEITESLLASNVPDIKAKMQALQRHGVSFSIDDFGTGYSSLFYLKHLPINQLKIDQSFVRDIINSPNDRAIAQTVITLADSMRLNVIAEGVETAEQRALLESMGCKAYQGYFFGRPCALKDLANAELADF
ncbi:MAG: EAL domain-containing protein [Oleiphilaceae bacterium]|nr:EAL domain-containing protein [Oleiphilaceae bacterium]